MVAVVAVMVAAHYRLKGYEIDAFDSSLCVCDCFSLSLVIVGPLSHQFWRRNCVYVRVFVCV